LPTFGERLKREREKRAVTLEQISSSTKIGTRMLQALEEEKFSQLPGGIFNKGFVRAYARCVGLDEDQAVADYLEASGESAPAKIEAAAESESRAPESSADGSSRDLPWGLFAAVLLLVALVLSIWSYRKRELRAPSAAPPSAPSALQNPSPAAGGPDSASEASIAVRSSNPVSPQVKPAGIATGPQTGPTTGATGATQKTAAPQLAPAAVPSQSGEFTVVIQAREDSWVWLTSDGNTILSHTLIAGTQRSVRARKEVVVRAGNSGAVDFFFNGKKLAAQGDYGEVKTLTFGATGLVPNRPAPPATQ
jgi:cytoskeleton protein RodZ